MWHFLTMEDRNKIEVLHAAGVRPRQIAQAVGVSEATIYNELRRGRTQELYDDMRPKYNAMLGQKIAQENNLKRGKKKGGRKKCKRDSTK